MEGAVVTYMTTKGGDLVKAVEHGDIEKCRRILELEGVDIHERDSVGLSSIRVASYKGRSDLVDLLISKGASVHDNHFDGRSPLYIASYQGYFGVAEILISNGASIHDKDNQGNTPLMIATEQGYFEVVELLMSKGANVDGYEGNQGDTPIMRACRLSHIKVVKVLLSNGASIHNKNGTSCFSYASNKDVILHILRKWPITMAILVLTELGIYFHIDCSSLIDLYQYIG